MHPEVLLVVSLCPVDTESDDERENRPTRKDPTELGQHNGPRGTIVSTKDAALSSTLGTPTMGTPQEDHVDISMTELNQTYT